MLYSNIIVWGRIGNSQWSWSLHKLLSLIFHDFFRPTFSMICCQMVIIFTSPIFSIFISISVAVIHTIRSEMTEEESRVGILKELELDVDDFRKHTAPLIPAPVATLGDQYMGRLSCHFSSIFYFLFRFSLFIIYIL